MVFEDKIEVEKKYLIKNLKIKPKLF